MSKLNDIPDTILKGIETLTYRQKQKLVTHIKNSLDKFTKLHKTILINFNEVTGHSLKPVPQNLRFIKARLDEGHTPEDLMAVVAIKTLQWKGTKWEMYLRPCTIFNATKFQGYVMELKTKSTAKTREERKNLW